MKRFLNLIFLAAALAVSPVLAEDGPGPLVAAVSTSSSSAQSSEFDCGLQVLVQCKTADAHYRVCHAVTGTTCTATTTDPYLFQSVSYDIPVRSDAPNIKCRFAFITDSASGSCAMFPVNPRTIPSNLQ